MSQLIEAIEFAENLIVNDGRGAGEPLRLMDFQKRLLADLFAEPRPRIEVLSMARGAGKTSTAAILAALALRGVPENFWPSSGREVSVIAQDSRIAAKVLRNLRLWDEQMSWGCRVWRGATPRVDAEDETARVELRGPSAAALRGGSACLVILDEFSVLPDSDSLLEVALTGAQKSSPAGVIVAMSTAGGKEGVEDEGWRHLLDDLADPHKPRIRGQHFAAPENLTLDAGVDELRAGLRAANPALGVLMDEDDLLERLLDAKARGGRRAREAQMLLLNTWPATSSADNLPPWTAQDIVAAAAREAPQEGDAWIGLASGQECASAACWWPSSGRLETLVLARRGSEWPGLAQPALTAHDLEFVDSTSMPALCEAALRWMAGFSGTFRAFATSPRRRPTAAAALPAGVSVTAPSSQAAGIDSLDDAARLRDLSITGHRRALLGSLIQSRLRLDAENQPRLDAKSSRWQPVPAVAAVLAMSAAAESGESAPETLKIRNL